MNDLVIIKTELNKQRGKLDLLNNEIYTIKENLSTVKESLIVAKEAQKIIQIVAKDTQSKIEYRISNLITSCIQNLGKNYKFVCEFVTKRDRTECEMYLTNESGEKLDPYAEVGGSIVQIIDFALRCTIWSLQKNKVNNFLFLDESFSGIKNILYKKIRKIVKEISTNLKLQLIFISHDDDLKQLGDNIIYLEKDNLGRVVCGNN